MSLLKEGYRKGAAAVAASAAVLLAGAGCDYKNTQNVNLSLCNVDPQPKTINVRIKEGDSVNIGDLTLTTGNNSGEVDAHLRSGVESGLSMFLIKNGAFFIDRGTGRIVQITAQKDWSWFRDYTELSIKTNCDQ